MITLELTFDEADTLRDLFYEVDRELWNAFELESVKDRLEGEMDLYLQAQIKEGMNEADRMVKEAGL